MENVQQLEAWNLGGFKLLRNQDGIYGGASAAECSFPTPALGFSDWPSLPFLSGGEGMG